MVILVTILKYRLLVVHQIMYPGIARIGVEDFTFELHFMTLRISCQQEPVATGGSQT